MADEAQTPKRGSLTWLWMVLALVLVAGFLVWLGVASEPSSVAVVEEGDSASAEAAGGMTFTEVAKDTLAAGKARFEGERVRVAGVQVTGKLGPSVFWGELGDRSNQVPILVRMDSALTSAGLQVEQGAAYTITGLVQRMTDSVTTAWGEEGVFADEGSQMQATFADYYIRASNVRPSQGGSAGSTGGETSGGAGG